MRQFSILLLIVPTNLLLLAAMLSAQPDKPIYQKKATREETIVASLRASGLPTLEGKWYYIGPFDNTGKTGFGVVYPPEKEIDLSKTYKAKGKDKQDVSWKEFVDFKIIARNDLARFGKHNQDACVYLYHEIEVPEAVDLPIALGSDDTLTVWLNGKQLLAEEVYRPAAPDQNQTTLRLRPGRNQLLIKVCNGGGPWELFIRPELPTALAAAFDKQLKQDFPSTTTKPKTAGKSTPEDVHYRIVTLPVPKDCVLEVGGLAFRPDGKLLACTRRGEVWLISNPHAENPDNITFQQFAFGLHEALGLHVDGNDVYVVQRPELTKLIDRNGDDRADEFVTICDKWGVSGDYHEFAFGPARDRQGNFYVTLNVGFGGGNPARAPYRGWCVKITPRGDLIPYACGLRSPNGLNFNPEGDLFYCDNQGEWVATGKMHQIREGEWYGHPVGLRWVPASPFADKIPLKYPSGMFYDGQAGSNGVAGRLPFTPPVILFPYGRMGQSQSEPLWDTTAGKFGPFAGQCFVGDQTNASILRVDLQKMPDGRYQGAAFPFRGGFECGINRLTFGPDGSLYVGMTNRGWGSRGGRPWGLQRLVYTGVLPFEIHSMKLTKEGFDLTFTKPLEATTADRSAAYSLISFTYHYWGTYGSPEVDRRAEKVEAVQVSPDRKKVSLRVNGLRPGRVYELRLEGIKSADGEPVLHPEAYYTLNHLP